LVTARRTVIALAAILITGICPAWAHAQPPDSPLPATFLQLWDSHKQWDDARWASLFGWLQQLRVREVVVQWSAYGENAYDAQLERIFAEAEAHGMKVWVGLTADPGIWETSAKDPDLLRAALLKRAARNEEQAARLAGKFAKSKAFQGWYIAEEVDDVHWRGEQKRAILRGYLKQLSGSLHGLTPGAEVSLSGFTNLQLSPRELAAFWKDISSSANLDVIFLQDGIGAGKVPLGEWPRFLHQFVAAFQGSKAQVRVVVETFQQDRSAEAASGFKAAPAPLERILRQAEIALKATGNPPIAFSLPDYLTPLGGPDAEARFEEYLRWLSQDNKP
jgi:hypothetical protein